MGKGGSTYTSSSTLCRPVLVAPMPLFVGRVLLLLLSLIDICGLCMSVERRQQTRLS